MTQRQQMFHTLGKVPESVVSSPQAHVSLPQTDATAASSFFTDLDSYTEYWDVYRPELKGRYMRDVGVLFDGALKKWFELATSEGTEKEAIVLEELKSIIAQPKTTAALKSIDELMLSLLRQYFGSAVDATTVDANEYLGAVEWFARDLLPDDADRLARVPQDDARYPFAGRHRMDGSSMWFVWAAVIDCAAILAADSREDRSLQIAGSAFGSALDFVFRGEVAFRGKTRAEYKPDEATVARLRSDVKAWAMDLGSARAQARQLYRIFSS